MCDSQEDFPNNEIWTRCYNPKWKDLIYPKWEVVLGAPNRVNIPCLMHDTCLCQIDVKITNCNTRRATIYTILRNGQLALYINIPTAK